MHFQTSFTWMQMISAFLQKPSRTKTKHCSSSRENIMGTNQVFAKVPHLFAEVWSRWTHSTKWSRENLGFPSFEEHEEHGCKDHNVSLQKSEISCYEFKNMDLGTHTRRFYENKHKNMNLNANFRIKQGFLFKTTWITLSLSKPDFKSMHGLQIRFDHSMQLDDQ